jgi:DNA-binding LacI/PurR family transcriptional regulator
MNKKNKCTIKDIAEYANVGISTVSRVLNKTSNPISITETTKKKIYEAVKKFDYTPNINAKRLSKNQSLIIALIIPGYADRDGSHAFSDYTLMETMRGIEDSIINTPYKLLLVFKTEKYVSEKEYLKLFREKCIDGMIIWGASLEDKYIDELDAFPVIQINTRNKLEGFKNYIGHDNFKGGCEITEYLIEKGYKNFLYFKANQTNTIAIERCNGFLKALEKHNIEIDSKNIIDCSFDWTSAYEIMDELLEAGKLKFDCVVTPNDSIAFGVYKAALKHGKKIPEDFALTGGDGIDPFIETSCPLTTFKVDCFKMGQLAINKLTALIEGKLKGSFEDLLTPEIIIRNSA